MSGARAATAWHGTLSEMGMVVVSSTIAVGPIRQTLSAESEPVGDGGEALERAFPRLVDESHVVGGSGENAARAQGAAVLKRGVD